MDNLFISYRRDDSAAYAGRICDRLTALIGGQRVFMDVEAIQPGQNFAQAIENTLASCSHVLVVIGPRWRDILQVRAQRAEEDYVVREIAAALTKKKNVVPVFVGGATSAMLSALPPALADLHFRQAVELHDASFNDDCTRLAQKLRLTFGFRRRIPLALSTLAVLGILVFSAAQFGLGPWRASHERKLQVAGLLSTAQTQAKEEEYESAFQSYQQALTLDPRNALALDGEVNSAMLWLDHFHVLTPAAPVLAQLNTVLTAGLARTDGKDKHAADILAHLGWLHWINEKIAFKEFGSAERYFAQSLAVDASNVYAHAFWGNWLLQTHGDSAQALKHFEYALSTNTERPLVRSMQLGGLLENDDPGMRAAFVKALNQVRMGNEPLEQHIQDRVSYLYSPTVSSAAELDDALAAVSPEDAWKTFLWLNPEHAVDAKPPVLKYFVHASLTELSGNKTAAAVEFKELDKVLKTNHFGGRMVDYTDDAIRRLRR